MNEKMNKKFKTHYYIGACLGIGISIFVKSIQIINIAGLIVILGFIVTLWILYSKDMTIQKQKTMAQFAEEYRIKEENLRNEFLRQFQQKIDLILPMLSSIKKQKEAIQIINSDVPIINTTPINAIPIKQNIREANQTVLPEIKQAHTQINDDEDIKIGTRLDIIKATLVNIENENIITRLYFNTEDELQEWRNKKHKLELKLNKTILKIEVNRRNRRQIILTCIPIDRYLPDLIQWDVKTHADLNKENYKDDSGFNIIIGESMMGIEKINLLESSHLVVCGSTNSGKSVLTRSIIYQYLEKGAKVMIMDYKNGIDYAFCRNHVDMAITRPSILKMLESLIEENSARLDLFLQHGADNIHNYNAKVQPHQRLSRICAIIDEATDLVNSKAKENKEICDSIREKMETLVAKGRSAGIHVTLTTQKASAKVFGGDLKDNLTARIIGFMASDSASKTMLDCSDAAKIPDIKGRFVLKRGSSLCEIQCPYFKGNNIIFSDHNTKTLLLNNKNQLKIAK